MNFTSKNGLALVALVIAIIACFLAAGNGKTVFGNVVDTSYFDYFQATTGFQLGSGLTFFSSSGIKVNSTSTTIGRMNTGTCYIQAYATTIAASSTAKVECQGTAAVGGITTVNDTALTGVTTGDYVQTRLATSTAGTTSLGLNITGASASTTPGYIEMYIINSTGTTFTWPTTGAATGTASYFVTR